MATTKPTVESTRDRIPIELINSANLKALAGFITNNCKRILNPSNVDEYLDVVHGVMLFVKHYCRTITQNNKEGDFR